MSFLFYLGFFLLLVHNYYSHAVGNNDPRTTNNNNNNNSNKNSKNAPHLVIPKNAVLAFSITSSTRGTLSISRNSRTTDCKTTTAARTVDPITTTTTARQRRFHGIFCSNRHNMVSDPNGGVMDPTGLPNATTSTSTTSTSSSNNSSSSSSSSTNSNNNSYNTMKTTTQSSFTPNKPPKRVTLRRYLHNIVKADPSLRDLESLSLSIQMACKTISNLVSRAGINSSSVSSSSSSSSSYNNSNNNNYSSSSSVLEEERDAGLIQYDYRMNSMKRLDQLSTIVLRNALRFTGKLQSVQKAKDDDDKQDDDDDDDDVQDDQEKVGGLQSRRKNESSNRGLREASGGGVPSEHQPGVLIASTLDSKYIAIFDPLDGSGNADAAICTGTVFGIFQTGETDQDEKDNNNDADDDDDDDDQEGIDNVVVGGGDGMDHPSSPNILVNSVLQPGKKLVAAGYCLYSSSTILVFTLGEGTHGFTLDPQINEFVLTHPNIKIPPRGNVYSCNEANSEGWSDDVRKYLHALKSGENETGERYALRYVGSMVGDIHRTLMYGGIFFYPADSKLHPKGHLQLLYKSAPLSFVIQQAGGRSTNGRVDLLGVTPSRVHETSPCFIGSPEDIEEMKTYVLHDD